MCCPFLLAFVMKHLFCSCLFVFAVIHYATAQMVPTYTIEATKGGYEVTWIYPDGRFEVIHYAPFDTAELRNGKDKKHGETIAYHADSTIAFRKNYTNGKLDGVSSWFYKTGEPYTLLTYNNGKLQKVENYYRNGQLKRVEHYDGDWQKSIGGQCFDSLGMEIDFTPYRVDPQFVGGMEALRLYILSKIYCPPTVTERCSTIVSFKIDKKGYPMDVKVHKSSGYEYLDKQATRVVWNMPEWIPGTLDGKVKSIGMKLPINGVPISEESNKSKRK